MNGAGGDQVDVQRRLGGVLNGVGVAAVGVGCGSLVKSWPLAWALVMINCFGCWASVLAAPSSKGTKSFRHWMFGGGSPRMDHLKIVFNHPPDGRLLVQQHLLNERRGPWTYRAVTALMSLLTPLDALHW